MIPKKNTGWWDFSFCAYVKLNKSKGICFGALPVLFYEIHELKFDEEKKNPQQQQQKFGRCGGGGFLIFFSRR
jgi:hypothetical protein